MPSLVSALVNAITRLNRLVFVATVWLMAPVVPIMIYEVIARYLFGAPTVWAMELVVLVFGPYFLLGGPYLSIRTVTWDWTCCDNDYRPPGIGSLT